MDRAESRTGETSQKKGRVSCDNPANQGDSSFISPDHVRHQTFSNLCIDHDGRRVPVNRVLRRLVILRCQIYGLLLLQHNESFVSKFTQIS